MKVRALFPTDAPRCCHLSRVVNCANETERTPASGIAERRDGEGSVAHGEAEAPQFEAVYDAYFAFVWRVTRHLGVEPSEIDDVVQEIFVVVHRKLGAFEGRSSVRTWLYAITRKVVADHRRAASTRARRTAVAVPETMVAAGRPDEHLMQAEATALVARILGSLEIERREIFALVELEQLAVPEVAEVLGVNVNTAYTRLRAARQDFEAALRREKTKEARRCP